jgi:hypothetical protein
VCTASKFLAAALHVAHNHTLNLEFTPVRRVPARHAEPLSRNRVPVFQSGIADIPGRYIGVVCKLARNPLGIRARLFNPEVIVLAIAGGFPAELSPRVWRES